MNNNYIPPFEITPSLLDLVSQVSEAVGRYIVLSENRLTPHLRRNNRIRTIQASLAIENNSLTVEEVTAVLDGKRVAGSKQEILEVKNAFAAYEAMNAWTPTSTDDLLKAHRIMMDGLDGNAGAFRHGGVGVFKGSELIHMAPPAKRVPKLISDLMNWLKTTNINPLITSSVFHYKFEFIHPFSDGNGRMGRLWQTLIFSKWKPELAYLPVETVVKENQQTYYNVLREADKLGKSTPFIEFMLKSLLESLNTDQVNDHVTDQVKKVVKILVKGDLTALELMQKLKLAHRPAFRQSYLNPAISGGFVELTQPNSPKSPTQRYRLTAKGGLYAANL